MASPSQDLVGAGAPGSIESIAILDTPHRASSALGMAMLGRPARVQRARPCLQPSSGPTPTHQEISVTHAPLRFGIFLAPFHPVREDPTGALDRDLALIELLDALRYDEAWIGEHHSAGYEIISSPEIFMAAAAERTKQIRLGTGVVSLPYHHPYMVAERIVQLDHMTRGRCMLGVGPGSLQSDAKMLGLEPTRQRAMMEESLEVIIRLLRGEVVTHKSDWFELNEARLHLNSYSDPHVDVAVASQISPAGARMAGRFGLGLLSVGATSAGGFDALSGNFDVWRTESEKHGHAVDRSRWRLVGPMHIAETTEQARENVKFGLEDWLYYFQKIANLPLGVEGSLEEAVDQLVDGGFAVIGSPEDAIAQIERLQAESGGFGTYLIMATNWADWAQTRRSYELISRYVMPHFQGRNAARSGSVEWTMRNRPSFQGDYTSAITKEIEDYAARQGGEGESRRR
jgi:limonene 1,2-monooxygenase